MLARAARMMQPLAIAAVGLLFCAFYFRAHPTRTLSAYLFAWLFFLGLSLGSLAALMMHHLTGGRWSAPVHRFFVAALSPLPLLLLLFVPVALGMAHLFPWVTTPPPTAWPVSFKSDYLTPAGFLLRSAIALLVWNVLALLLAARSAQGTRATGLSAAGVMIYGVTMTWAAVDWIGSLQPHWSSTALGLVVLTAQGLGAFALATLCATRRWRASEIPTAGECGDLGNLLLTFVMTWMYLAFVEFLIIWGEDLPRETVWYLPRLKSDWLILTVLVVIGQFALPFALLLFRRVKRHPGGLGLIALLVLCSNWLYCAWLILPTVRSSGPYGAWPDLFATALVGGLWWSVFLRRLRRLGPDASAPSRAGASSANRELSHGS